ncbi:MAG: hypothetical protein Q9225_005397 [Loekoesia sp. 1 TL-2023]
MLSSSDISEFKRSICKAVIVSLDSPESILTNIRDLRPNAANQFSYDLDFLSRRIKLLIGSAASGNGEGFLASWSKTPRSFSNRVCSKGCLSVGRKDSRIWQNIATQELRCGGCGRKDLTIVLPDPAIKNLLATVSDAIQMEKGAKQHQSSPFNGIRSSKDTTNPRSIERLYHQSINTSNSHQPRITTPPSWAQTHDTHLRESYITQIAKHNFSILNLKLSLSIFFPASHPSPSIRALHIDPSTYDLCFIHNRLETLFGACLCRNTDTSSSSVPRFKRCYFHPFIRTEVSNSGKLLECGKCGVDPPAVYAVPVEEASVAFPACKKLRCGGCGNEEVKEVEVSEEGERQFEHLKRFVREVLAGEDGGKGKRNERVGAKEWERLAGEYNVKYGLEGGEKVELDWSVLGGGEGGKEIANGG